MLSEFEAKLIVTFTRAGPEPATMNAEHRGHSGGIRFGSGEVELKMLIVRIGIFDAALKKDVVRDGQLSSVADGGNEQ